MKPASQSLRYVPADWLHPLAIESLFPRRQPLEVDVGFGKGRFLLARSAAHPEINFLGIERMLRRLRKVDRKAVRRGLDNVRLLRIEAYYATAYLIPAGCVQTYYIFFPDPWPKKRHAEHRLFNAAYLDALHRTLLPGGCVHFATDHQPYFQDVRARFMGDARFEEVAPLELAEEERTDFELLFRGQTEIGRCSFRRRTADAPAST